MSDMDPGKSSRIVDIFPRYLWKLSQKTGLVALGRAIASHWPFPVRTTVINGCEMYVDLRSSIGRGLFATGSFDMGAIQPILNKLQPGATMIDVGANVGFYSVLASALVGDRGHVYAFEIDPRPLQCLRKTIALSGLGNIHIAEAAVSDTDGSVTFIPADEHGHNHIELQGDEGCVVASVRLDTWADAIALERLDAIKIDVEGAEKLVLEGARGIIARFKPLIICEASLHTALFGYPPELLIKEFDSIGYDAVWLDEVCTATLLATPRVSGLPRYQ